MRIKIIFLTMIIMVFGVGGYIVAYCPEHPNDNGDCDTFYVVCEDPVKISPPPSEVHFMLLVTHDLMSAVDSLAAFEIPLKYYRSNPAAYCSLLYRNNSVNFTDTANSIFRHFGGMQNRMMNLYQEGNGGEWNSRNILLPDQIRPSLFGLGLYSTGSEDQKWWEGSKTLLATMTFLVSDTMTICIDTTYLLRPDGSLLWFVRSDAVTYVPRDNLPYCTHIIHTERGDANGDLIINITDIMYMINYLFRHGPAPISFETGDANCDNDHGILDVVFLINYLYKNGPSPHCP